MILSLRNVDQSWVSESMLDLVTNRVVLSEEVESKLTFHGASPLVKKVIDNANFHLS